MDLSAKIEMAGFENQLRKYMAGMRKGTQETLRAQGRNLAVNLAFQTQPFGDKQSARQTGVNAIKTDLFGGKRSKKSSYRGVGLLRSIDENTVKEKEYHDSVRVAKGHAGSETYLIQKNSWQPQASNGTIKAFHQSARSDKTGRVAYISSSTVGRWKVLNQMWVNAGAAMKYWKNVAKKVGLGKAGWSACAKSLGGTRGIPGWVSRQKGFGHVVDKSAQENGPYIEVINSTRYIKRILSDKQVKVAYRITMEKMMKQLQTAQRAEARKAGL